MPIVHPPVLINAYLADKIEESLPDRFSESMRFFPTLPTDINALTEQFPEAADNVFAVYDRMFRLRRTPFPHIKQEQLLYYFYKMAGDSEALIETLAVVYELLDRGDESAQDLNQWLRMQYNRTDRGTSIALKKTGQNKNYVKDENNEYQEKEGDIVEVYDGIILNNQPFMFPYFHEFKIFQLEEARDIIAFGTARTYAGNKLILNYEWHQPSPKETHYLPEGSAFKGDWASSATYSENEAVWLVPTITFDPSTQVDLSTNTLTIAGHGLRQNLPVRYNSIDGEAIGGLVNGRTYYANVINANAFRLLATPSAENPVNLSSVGTTNLHSFVTVGPVDQFSSSSESSSSEYGKIWISLQSSNRGNTPVEGSSFWIPLEDHTQES